MRIFPSRKAQTELTLQQIIGLVIAIVIVLATVGLFFSLMMLFVGPPDSGSVRTLEVLYDTVMSFDNPDNHNTSCFIRPVYIGEDWSIVGFNEDGVITASNDWACHLGEDCIEEQCGWDDNIIKPGQCGNGPCLCLCDGGGDVDGDDCQESGAVCRKIPRNAGFDRFYYPDGSEDDCITYSIPERTRWNPTYLCDLVVPSESCVLQENEGAQKSLVVILMRQGNHEENQILVDRVFTSQLEDVYPSVTTDCAQMVEDLRRFRATTPGEALPEEGQEGQRDPTLYQEIDVIRRE